jgi:LysM repeat protein
MILIKIFIVPFFLLNSFTLTKDPIKEYIEKYDELAIREMNRMGIPASIKLAQAILESENGKSILAVEANNHFGIKCGKDWHGNTFFKYDDDANNEGEIIESCFRSFNSVEESFKAHSEFLTDQKKIKRYGFLFNLEQNDYKAWAFGLKQAGYATDAEYPSKLIRIIEKYELYKLDKNNGIKNDDNKKIVVPDTKSIINNSKLKNEKELVNLTPEFKIIKINDKKAIKLLNKVSLESLAQFIGKKSSELISINELLFAPSQVLEANTILFIEKKKNDYDGKEKFHLVKNGETLEIIANFYGVKIQTLQSLNRIHKFHQPLVGEKINLKEKVGKNEKPKTIKVEPKERFLFEI